MKNLVAMRLLLLVSVFVTATKSTNYTHGNPGYSKKRSRNPGMGSIGRQDAVDFDAFDNLDLNLITGPFEDMFKSGYSKKKINRGNANERIRRALNSAKETLKAKAPQWDREHQVAAAGAVATVVGGGGSLAKGIQEGDLMTALSGALAIAAAVASITGPVGAILGTLLTIASTVLSFLGSSSSTEPKESDESMMKRIISAELEESQYNLLKNEIAGVQFLYSTMYSSIENFRRQNEELGEDLNLSHGTEMYNLVFQELVSFGVLKQYINKFCEAGLIKEDLSNIDRAKLYAKRCGVLVRLYCSLSIRRQFLLTNLAALLNGDGKSEEQDALALRKISKNIVHMLNREQEMDHDFLRFLNDPINYPQRRYAVYCLFGEPEKNDLLTKYLGSLNKNFPYYPGFYKPPVLRCEDKKLQGYCQSLYNKIPVPSSPRGTSVFIPIGTKVNDLIFNHYSTGTQMLGPGIFQKPLLDPWAWGKLKEMDTRLWDTYKLDYNQDVENDGQAEVRICGYGYENSDYCRVFEAGTRDHPSFQEVNLKDNLFENVTSAYIPTNRTVTLYDADGVNVVRKFHGPNFLKSICNNEEWINAKKVKFEKSYNIRQVKVCDGVDLSGKCHAIRLPDHKESAYINLFNNELTGGCDFTYIGSIQIPNGIDAEIQLRKHRGVYISAGPFHGPITIAKLAKEGFDYFKFLKLFDRIDKAIQICEGFAHDGECIVFKEESFNGHGNPIQLSTMKSVKVPSGISVTLYADKSFEGQEETVTGPDAFRSENFAFQSFKVREVPVEEALELDAVEEMGERSESN